MIFLKLYSTPLTAIYNVEVNKPLHILTQFNGVREQFKLAELLLFGKFSNVLKLDVIKIGVIFLTITIYTS